MPFALSLESLASLYTSLPPASCMPDGCFCEAVRAGVVRQPANAASSITFVAVGARVLRYGGRSAATLLPGARFASAYGWGLIAIGVASALHHATLILAAQFLDMLTTYLFGALLVVGAAGQTWRLGQHPLAGAYVVLATAFGTLAYTAPGTGAVGIASLVASYALLERRRRRRSPMPDSGTHRSHIASAVLFGAAVALFAVDATGVFCSPRSILQGHALWHVFAACAAGVFYDRWCPARPLAAID